MYQDSKKTGTGPKLECRRLGAQQLFRGEREIEIVFRGDIYRLRITRNDKLILTK